MGRNKEKVMFDIFLLIYFFSLRRAFLKPGKVFLIPLQKFFSFLRH